MRRFWKWLRRATAGFIGTFLLLCLVGAVYHPWKTRQTEAKYPAPGKLVDVGGHKLHYNVKGNKKPVVVIDTGLGAASYDWTSIQQKMSKFATVVSFDRAGYGWSEPGPLPRTADRNVEELRVLLQKSGLPPPYVLCGHSYGGYTLRLFASLYPEDVSALVLVEALNTDTFTEEPWVDEEVTTVAFPIRFARGTAAIGTTRIMARLMHPPGMHSELHARTQEFEAMYQEWAGMSNWREVRRKIRPLGKLPVTVISANNDLWSDWWPDAQEALANSASDDVVWIRLKGGHMVNAEEPEVIVQAVSKIIQRTAEHEAYWRNGQP